jgi:RNA polymerase sigma-70 factor (ECF subfamily)
LTESIEHPHLELINACKQNNRQAQHRIYNLYAQAMFNVCYRIVNQQEEAEDVLQEAFVKMFKQINTFREEASFGAWFKRVVINCALNHVKQRQRLEIKVEKFKNENDTPIFEEDEESNLPDFSVSEIKSAMELLPEGYRIVFSLYLFEEFSHKEIADELGITESTSKSQLNRAKKKMREILEFGMKNN